MRWNKRRKRISFTDMPGNDGSTFDAEHYYDYNLSEAMDSSCYESETDGEADEYYYSMAASRRNREKKSKRLRIVAAGVLLLSLIVACVFFIPAKDSVKGFEIYFLDVGEGDSAVIVCDGHAMIIDGGNSGKSSYLYSFLKQHNLDKLDYMVCTHPDADHVGGLAGALNYAKVGKAFCSVKQHDTKTFQSFVKYLEKQNLKIRVPSSGDSLRLGSAKVTILGSQNLSANSSIVLKVDYCHTSFMFTGDATETDEKAVLSDFTDIRSTVLKVGHHGSVTSTSAVFLEAVSPEYAVISVGGDNDYGHPTKEVLDRLKEFGTRLYRTDMQGTIKCTSNGETVSFEVEKNPDIDTYSAQGGYLNYLESLTNSPSDDSKEENTSSNADGRNLILIAAEEALLTKPDSGNSVRSQNNFAVNTPEPVEATPKVTAKPTATPSPVNTPKPTQTTEPTPKTEPQASYIANTNTKKFHYPWCYSVDKMKESNKWYYTGSRQNLIDIGYVPCKNCNP